MKKPITNRRIIIIWAIYGIALLFSILKMYYYAEEITGFPDESRHISYIIYLDQSPQLVPEFADMQEYKQIDQVGQMVYYEPSAGTTNYLGHAPLYYYLMQPFADVHETDIGIAVNIQKLRMANIFLTAGTLALVFYFGYSRLLKKSFEILPHLIFAAATISVPMLAYVGAGISNDNLVFLGMALFWGGLLRYYENQLDIKTYLLVGVGFFIVTLSKLTGAEIIVVTLLVLLITDFIRKKGGQVFKSKYFWSTLVLYLIPVIYYLIVYSKYGSVQPSLQVLDYEYYKTTSFYVPENERLTYSFVEYLKYYWDNFVNTWAIIYGHNGWVVKDNSFAATIGAYGVVVFFVIQTLKSMKGKTEDRYLFLSVALGICAVAFTQFISAYRTFKSAGYMGGYQARYYLCMIPCLAYGNAMLWSNTFFNTIKVKMSCIIRSMIKIIGVIYVLLLLYGDFAYFLLNRQFVK